MKVQEVFYIRNRGCVACVQLDEHKLFIGTVLRRKSDQCEITVYGIESHAIPRPLREHDTVGLLVSPAVDKGDELERIP